ncbi:MAG: lipoprotein [Pseudomonadota bacterium]
MKRPLFVAGVLAVLAACEQGPGQSTGAGANFATQVPEEVLAVADPRHVGTARLLEDGCYWYVHDNAVETTFLPLRTADGRPICALTAEERAARAAEAAQEI